jgi:hypothetical protein
MNIGMVKIVLNGRDAVRATQYTSQNATFKRRDSFSPRLIGGCSSLGPSGLVSMSHSTPLSADSRDHL